MPETNNTKEASPVNENVELHTSTRSNTIPHSHMGPILAVLVILLLVIFGGIYLWGNSLQSETHTIQEIPIINDEPETIRATADTQILETLSPSDELDAIEADLSSTNLDILDADLNAIDAEFDSSLQREQ